MLVDVRRDGMGMKMDGDAPHTVSPSPTAMPVVNRHRRTPASARGTPMTKTKMSQRIAGREKPVPPPSVPEPCGMAWFVAGSKTVVLSPICDDTTMGVVRGFHWCVAGPATNLRCGSLEAGEA